MSVQGRIARLERLVESRPPDRQEFFAAQERRTKCVRQKLLTGVEVRTPQDERDDRVVEAYLRAVGIFNEYAQPGRERAKLLAFAE